MAAAASGAEGRDRHQQQVVEHRQRQSPRAIVSAAARSAMRSFAAATVCRTRPARQSQQRHRDSGGSIGGGSMLSVAGGAVAAQVGSGRTLDVASSITAPRSPRQLLRVSSGGSRQQLSQPAPRNRRRRPATARVACGGMLVFGGTERSQQQLISTYSGSICSEQRLPVSRSTVAFRRSERTDGAAAWPGPGAQDPHADCRSSTLTLVGARRATRSP